VKLTVIVWYMKLVLFKAQFPSVLLPNGWMTCRASSP